MSSYLGYHAQLYDIFYKEKDYLAEAQFLHQLIKQFSKKTAKTILELACGTGNHALALEKLGYTITATDYSKDMLAVAQEKAKTNQSKVAFQLVDMRELPKFPQSFDASLCLFDSIGYVLTNEAVLQVLKGIHQNLKSDGLFIFEFWHAAAMLKFYEPHRERNFQISEKHVIYRISETTLDIKNQTATVKYTIDEKKNGKEIHHLKEAQQNRFFQVQEMKLFLENSGFELLTCYDGFSTKEQIDDQTWHVVAVARKK